MAESEDYLRGFVHGMDFLLLALEGRLASGTMTRGQAEQVFAEYHALVRDYRESAEAVREAPERADPGLFGDEAPQG